jgi:tetratricopeptide (TPR) repeat protein
LPTRAQKYTVSVRELRIPPKARAAFNRGVECLAKGDAAGSLRHFNRAIQEFPDFYEAYYDQGAAEMQIGQKSEAMQSFQKAIDLSGGHFARAYVGYGLVLTQQGKSEEAEPIVRRGLEEDPSLAEGYSVLSIVLFGENRLDEAEQTAQKALRMPNSSAIGALVTLAYIHLKREEYPSAVQNLEDYLKAVRASPFKADAGFLQYLEKKLSEAKEKSIVQNP